MGMRREEERLERPVRESDRKNLAYGQQEKSSAGHCSERQSSIYHPNLEIRRREDPGASLELFKSRLTRQVYEFNTFLCRNTRD